MTMVTNACRKSGGQRLPKPCHRVRLRPRAALRAHFHVEGVGAHRQRFVTRRDVAFQLLVDVAFQLVDGDGAARVVVIRAVRVRRVLGPGRCQSARVCLADNDRHVISHRTPFESRNKGSNAW